MSSWKPGPYHPFNQKARLATLKKQGLIDKLQERKTQAIDLLLENEADESPDELEKFFNEFYE